MPLVVCPACDHQQVVRRDLAGLRVPCESCGAEFRATEASSPRRRPPPAEPMDVRALARTVGLLAGLVAAVAVVMVVVILIVRPSAPKTEPTAKSAPARAREPSPEERRSAEQAADDRREQAATVGRTVAGLMILAVVIAYVLAVLLVGAWVARDANARGMPGLGWASFYYLFHLLARLAVIPLAILPSLIIPGLGLLVFLAVEPAAWVGLVVYLVARRAGRTGRCHNCGNRRLVYLVACPLCGVLTPPDGGD